MSTEELSVEGAAAEELSPEEIAEARRLREWLSFDDLQAMGVVTSWQTLNLWQREYGFPLGRLFGPNTRRWNQHTEINPWLASRPTAPAPIKKRQIAKARQAAKKARQA